MSPNWLQLSYDPFSSAFTSAPLVERLEAGLRGRHLLLTGATGFFGKWLLCLLAYLNERGVGVRVSAVSRCPAAFLSRYSEFNRCNWIHWIASDVRFLRNHDLGALDFVLHAACDTSTSAHAARLELVDSIVNGTLNILDVAVRGGVDRVLFTGSGAQYGPLVAGEPIAEHALRACDNIRTSGAYAEAKRFQETLGALYAEQYGLKVVMTRCFAFAGPGLPLDGHFAFGNFVRDALREPVIALDSSGEAVRSYLHGADLAIWLLFLLIEGQAGEAYNVGSDCPISIVGLAERVARRLAPGKPVRKQARSSGAPSYYVPNISKARSLGLDVWHDLDGCIDSTGRWAAFSLPGSKSLS